MSLTNTKKTGTGCLGTFYQVFLTWNFFLLPYPILHTLTNVYMVGKTIGWDHRQLQILKPQRGNRNDTRNDTGIIPILSIQWWSYRSPRKHHQIWRMKQPKKMTWLKITECSPAVRRRLPLLTRRKREKRLILRYTVPKPDDAPFCGEKSL